MSRKFFDRRRSNNTLIDQRNIAIAFGCSMLLLTAACVWRLVGAYLYTQTGNELSIPLFLLTLFCAGCGPFTMLISLVSLKRAYDIQRELVQVSKGQKYHFRD